MIQKEEILNSPEKQILVLACPGSGKTTLIIDKIIRLVKEGTPFNKILAVTFTRKAAEEMYFRLEKKIKISKFNKKNISTLHSFGFKILDKYKDLVGIRDDYEFATLDEQYEIAKLVLGDKCIVANDSLSSFISYVSGMKNGFHFPNTENYNVEDFNNYCSEMIIRNLIDLDDLIYLPLKILKENTDIRRNISNNFNYIFVDEYQDINKTQNEFIESLINTKSHLMYVGDDDQSIYEFRGSNPNYILDKSRDKDKFQVKKLTTNYRSQINIINLSNKVISLIDKNKRQEKVINAIKKSSNIKPFRKMFNSKDEEIEFVANEINRLIIDSDVDAKEIAVISRYTTKKNKDGIPIHKELFGIYNKLVNLGIPASFSKGANPNSSNSKIIREISDFLKSVFIKEKIEPEYCNYIEPNSFIRKKYNEIINAINAKYNTNYNLENFSTNVSEINKNNYVLDNKINEKYRLKLIKSFLYLSNQKKYVKSKAKPSEIISNLINYKSKLLEIDETRKRIYEFAFRYLKSAEKTSDTNDFNTVINGLSAFLLEEDEYKDKDSVKLITAHQSKGLQFDVVFVVGLEVGGFPNKNNLNDNDYDNERRLFYVSITRARELLYLTSTHYAEERLKNIEYAGKSFIFDLPENYFELSVPNLDKVDFAINDSEKLIEIKHRKEDLIDLQEDLEISRNQLIEYKKRIEFLSNNVSNADEIKKLKKINDDLKTKIKDLESYKNINDKKINNLTLAKEKIEALKNRDKEKLEKIENELIDTNISKNRIEQSYKQEKLKTMNLEKLLKEKEDALIKQNALLEIKNSIERVTNLNEKRDFLINNLLNVSSECLDENIRKDIINQYKTIVLSRDYPLIDDFYETGLACFIKLMNYTREYNNKSITIDYYKSKIKQNSFKTNLTRIVSNILETICNYQSDIKEFKMIPFLKAIYDNNANVFYRKLVNYAKSVNKLYLTNKEIEDLITLYSITIVAGHKSTLIKSDQFVVEYEKELESFLTKNNFKKYEILCSYFKFINNYYLNEKIMKKICDSSCYKV